MPSLTPPWAANELWVAIGAETLYGGTEATTMYYIGSMARNDLPMMEQNQNQTPEWCTGLRVPVGFSAGAMTPRGRMRINPLPAFGFFASSAFTVTSDPSTSPYAFPGSLPSYKIAVGGEYLSGQPFMYMWTGCVVDSATIRWAEGERISVDFGWVAGNGWIEYNWDLDITESSINVGEKPLMWHEGSFVENSTALQDIYYAHTIQSGAITMRRNVQRAFGSGGVTAYKSAARAAWNAKVISQQIGADFVMHQPYAFASGANVGQNAPKWYGGSQATLRWTDSLSGNLLQVDLYRVEGTRAGINAARADQQASFGMGWVAADWDWNYTTS